MTWRRAGRWATPALLALEVALVLAGRLPVRTAGLVLVVVESVLALAAVRQLAAGRREYRTRRGAGLDREQSLDGALRAVLPTPVAVVLRHELMLWWSLLLLVRRRRHAVPEGAVALPYDAPLRVVGLLLVGLSLVEIVVLELIVPWQPVRVTLLVLGAWSLLLVLGLTAANVVRPHVVTGDQLLLRFGAWAQARVPLEGITGVAARRRAADGNGALMVQGEVLVMAVSGTTDVEVELADPTPVATSRGPVAVRTVRFAADDPAAAVQALRPALDRSG